MSSLLRFSAHVSQQVKALVVSCYIVLDSDLYHMCEQEINAQT